MTVWDIVSKWEQAPFKRGSTDCCAFVDHVVKEVTGESLLPEYDDDDSAFQILERHGGLAEAVSYYVGKGIIEDLQPGDIALINIKGHESIGVMLDNGNVAAIVEGYGLREMSPAFVDGGWAVGR